MPTHAADGMDRNLDEVLGGFMSQEVSGQHLQPNTAEAEHDSFIPHESDASIDDNEVPVLGQHVVNPSAVPLPDKVKAAMFVPPPNFGSKTLYDSMGTEEGL